MQENLVIVESPAQGENDREIFGIRLFGYLKHGAYQRP